MSSNQLFESNRGWNYGSQSNNGSNDGSNDGSNNGQISVNPSNHEKYLLKFDNWNQIIDQKG